MTFDNAMIPSGGGLSRPDESARRFFTGGRQPCVVELHVKQLDKTFRLDSHRRPLLIVGRSNDCDVTLPHPLVSYRHAYLQLVGGHVHCVDLASRTGTHWGPDERRSGWLLPGESVAIGPYTIMRIPAPAETPLDPELCEIDLLQPQARGWPPAGTGRGVELRFLNSRGDTHGRRFWRITQPVTLLGSSPRCRLRIEHASVSRVHCSLTVTPAGMWIADLLGKEGTWVNGEPVAFRLLNQGDRIRIGRFRFAVNYGRPPQTELPPSDDARSGESGVPASHPAPVGGYSEEFILALIDRFAAMQQQMSAMSQQQMTVMAQLVGTMHQNHHDVVRRELARIERLSEQIERLQAQLSERDRKADGGDAAAAQSSPLQPPAAGQQLPGDDAHLLEGPDPTAASSPARSKAPSKSGHAASPEESPEGTKAAGAASAQRAKGDDPHGDRSGAEASAAESDSKPPRFTPRDVYTHTQLVERMAALERERTSRWKKIVRILTGSGP